MDSRLRTTFIASTFVLVSWAAPLHAQSQFRSQTGNYSGTNYSSDAVPPAQRNSELPKGLTLVPWKIERRTSLSEIRSGQAGNSQTSSSQPRR